MFARTKSTEIAVVLTMTWLLLSLIFDRFVIVRICPTCRGLIVRFHSEVAGAGLTYGDVSAIAIAVVGLVPLIVYLIPWKNLASAHAWKQFGATASKPFVWFTFAILLTIAGNIFYLIIQHYLPDAITKIADACVLEFSVQAVGFKDPFFAIRGTGGSLIGLGFGLWFFVKYGIVPILES